MQSSTATAQLNRTLYRQLLRLAQRHDSHPCLKATLEHPRLHYKMGEMMKRRQQQYAASNLGSGDGSGGPGGARIIFTGPAATKMSTVKIAAVSEVLKAIVAKQLKLLPKPSSGGSSSRSSRSSQSPASDPFMSEMVHEMELQAEDVEHEDDAEEDEDDDEEELGWWRLSAAELAAVDDAGWSAAVSPHMARWYAELFQGADHYLPNTASMRDIVRSEFRRSLSTAAHSKRAAAKQHKHHGSHSTSHPPLDSQAQMTTDTFGVLRVLNKNLADGTAHKLLLEEQQVRSDPVFGDPATAPKLLPASSTNTAVAALLSLRSESGPDGDESAGSFPLHMRPMPASALRAGLMLVAHPAQDGDAFARTVMESRFLRDLRSIGL